MPFVPGTFMMPSVAVNVILSLLPTSDITVRSNDRYTVFSPMHDEEAGARVALTSLLKQSRPAARIVVSVNGGIDDTYGEVLRAIEPFGYAKVATDQLAGAVAMMETFGSSAMDTEVLIVRHYDHTGKAESVNHAWLNGHITDPRVVIVDGDTVFHEEFLAELDASTYELRFETDDLGRKAVLIEHAAVSGAVMSTLPEAPTWVERAISAAREAEYALSYVLRKGQTRRVGTNALTGASRLYTLIGCGFGARADTLPMPDETRTEDHDYTQELQNGGETRHTLERQDLIDRGLRFSVDGRELEPDQLFDMHDRIELRRVPDTAFAQKALMYTQDPATVPSLARQLDRWHGGGQENFLRRLGRRLRPNVAYALWIAVIESVASMLVVSALAVAALLHVGNPTLGVAPDVWLWWIGVDTAAIGALAMYGFTLFHRASGRSRAGSVWLAARDTLRTALPFTVSRYLNLAIYMTSATKVVPAYLRQRWRAERRTRQPRPTGTLWGGRSAAAGSGERIRAWLRVMGAGAAAAAVIAYAGWVDPIDREAWSLVHNARNPIQIEQHQHVPVAVASERQEGLFDALVRELLASPSTHLEPLKVAGIDIRTEDWTLGNPAARYCDPRMTPRIADAPRRMIGDSDAYAPLGHGELFILGRLAPLIGVIETAATAYGVPADFLVQVFIHESYLDPLAVGPTDDRGLAQFTSDGLTMLREVSMDASSRFFNPALVAGSFSVFDPAFSSCAGASRLAWTMQRAGEGGRDAAYALYINPIRGVQRGQISDAHQPLVDSMRKLDPVVANIANAFARYDVQPGSLTDHERALLELARDVRSGETSMPDAYRHANTIVVDIGLEDELYEEVASRLFDEHLSVLAPR